MSYQKYISELKRRNVIKSGIAYLVVAWVLLQVFSILLPLFEAPLWVLKTITLIMAVGFPIWVIFSWIYEITPEGIKKTKQVEIDESESNITNKKLNKLIIIFLSIAVIFLLVKLNWNQPNNENKVEGQLKETENLSTNLKALDFILKENFIIRRRHNLILKLQLTITKKQLIMTLYSPWPTVG